MAAAPAPDGAPIPAPAAVVNPAPPAAAAAPAPAPPATAAPVAIAASPPARAEVSFHPALKVGDQVITEDTVWRHEVLVEGVVTVAPQATLTVEPGTVIRFRRKPGAQSPLLMIQGRLVAQGTKETPVLFGSAYRQPAPDDWQGILLVASEKKNLLENCRIEGAQTGLEALYSQLTLKGVQAEQCLTGLRFQDSLLLMEGGGAADCTAGMKLVETEANLIGASFTGNRQGVQAVKSSLFLQGLVVTGNVSQALTADTCRIKVDGGSFQENGSGITLVASDGSVTGARLSRNRHFGLSLSKSRVKVTANEIVANREPGLLVEDGAAVAWGNAISDNGGFDVYNLGVEEFRAPGNWWGGSAPRIFSNNGLARVSYQPVLTARPPLGQVRPN